MPRSIVLQQYIRERVMVAPDGCWLWLLGSDKDGYGKAKYAGRSWRAHRLSFEAFRGPVPSDAILDHIVCDQPSCVNPWHVEPSTHARNVLRATRGNGPGGNSRKTHCKRGHEFTAENTHLQRKGNRVERHCIECARQRVRDWRARRRAR